jgi:YbgC/YbaW family acyl-CoA thioester hydrolase
MTDTPPPPSEKKPRRRGPPRKRAPAKRTTKQATEALQDGAELQADAVPAVVDTAAAASEPARVAAVIDPAPLADTAAAGDAPTGSMPAAASVPADTSRPEPSAGPADATPAAGSTPPVEPASSPSADAAEASTPPVSAAATAPSPRAEGTAATTSAATAPARATPAPEAIPRQASLRPGELIRVPLSVRWRDLDAFNHVNNSKYLSYLEEARLRWMLTIPGMGLDDDVAPVVAASNLNYRRPIEWPGDVVIELFVERLGNTSLTIGHRIVDATEGGVTYCDGNVVLVWIDRTSGRAAPLPGSVRAACARR